MLLRQMLEGKARRPPWLVFVLLCAYSAALLVLGVGIGKWFVDHHVRGQILAKLETTRIGRFISRHDEAPVKVEVKAKQAVPDVQHLDWKSSPALISNLYFPEVVKVRLAPFETYGEGGSIAEVSGNILYASPTGQLGYLSRKHLIRTIQTRVPMNMDVLQAHPVYKDPRLVMSYFRTLDMLVVPRTPATFDLYVSHHRFNSAGCFEFVVSRADGQVSDDSVSISNTWHDVFVARPCMKPKDVDLFWGGLESGGRLGLLNARTILVTIGDHQFDGIRSKIAAAQDPNQDLGKVVAIDLPSGTSRIYTSGHRNPQGLLVARDGTVWETEHAPQGGDEINLLQKGRNYGWPLVTYGVEYGPRQGPRRNWPLNPEQGRHDGYELPKFAFMPSIGISNLIQPDTREWPLWRDHLLVSSLGGLNREGGGKLYLARVEKDKQIVYAEEILVPVDDDDKLRDIISLSDGRFAVLAQSGTLLLIRNGEVQAASASPHEASFDVTLSDEAKAAVAQSTPMQTASDVDIGRQLFASKCAACHTVNGQIKVGPPLNGVVGRRMASVDGFTYSRGMKESGIVWNKFNLADFMQLLDPPYGPSPMPRPLLSYASATAVVAYLQEQR